MKKNHSSKGPRVLMVGYNGANNTGAEALLQADIEDVRAVLGPDSHITVPTLNEANLRRYLREGPGLKISPMPALFFGAIRRLVKQCDLVVLAEGSTYMDTWGSPLLWLFLWATACAADMGKPTLAYAVDAGTLSSANRRRVRSIASRTNLIVTRNQAAADRLRDIGVTAPMESTADNAFVFQTRPADCGWPVLEWPKARAGIVGFALVDFSLFPAVMRLWGRRERCYRWPYYFSSSPERRQFNEKMVRGYASLADHIAESTGKALALICMEQLDETLAEQVRCHMKNGGNARIFSARQYDASQMTSLLRSLDLLVTSRFHATVLSLAAGIPQIAVGHDTRLATIYNDIGLYNDWFINPFAADGSAWAINEVRLFSALKERIDRLLANPYLQKQLLYKGYDDHLNRARRNRRLLADFAFRYLGTAGACSPAPALPNLVKGGMAWA